MVVTVERVHQEAPEPAGTGGHDGPAVVMPVTSPGHVVQRESGSPPSPRDPALIAMDPAAMREMNLSSLLRDLVAQGPLARVQLAENTGISSTTVTKLIADMMDAGLVVEAPSRAGIGTTGRPRVPISIDPGSRGVFGIHLGAHSIHVGLVDLLGQVHRKAVVPGWDVSPETAFKQACVVLTEIQAEFPDCRVIGAGIGSSGLLDPAVGTALAHPPGWAGGQAAQRFEDALGVPVAFDDVARGAVTADLLFDSTRAGSVLLLYVGDVVTCALAFDGAVHRGFLGMAGGIQHYPVAGVRGPRCTCGRYNCLGRIATSTALVAAARSRELLEPVEGLAELVAKADNDVQVRTLLRRRARWVGTALAAMVDLIDPDMVVLAGNATRWPGYLVTVQSEIGALTRFGRPIATRLRQERVDRTASIHASAALLVDRYVRHPVQFEPGLRRAGHG